ncbi:MAG TPA: hypothetical protein VN805_09695 [Caulobacteraceae bacterium]|nr:hypothetical protein [Caulobacteraceae bacterium]
MAADPVVERNRAAWNAGRYDAWVDALGPPAVEAARLVADPRAKLRRLLPHLGEIVTAVIDGGFSVRRLEERPSWTDPLIPGTFILVADKPA